MPNELVIVSREIAKKYIDYYFKGCEYKNRKIFSKDLREAIYLSLENADKEVVSKSILKLKSYGFDDVFEKLSCKINSNITFDPEIFIEELVAKIREAESKEISKFDLFCLERRIDYVEKIANSFCDTSAVYFR